jgi:tRNA threonylcarbamoyladenosine modification (KEOPS) complex Cgi121 subunit
MPSDFVHVAVATVPDGQVCSMVLLDAAASKAVVSHAVCKCLKRAVSDRNVDRTRARSFFDLSHVFVVRPAEH